MDETIFETEVVTDVNAIAEEVTTKATTEEASTLDLDTYYLSYNEQYPRPSQPIIDLGIDPDWKAFLEEPAFPDWISGHGTIAYAAEVVSTEQFGDIDTFAVVSPDAPGIERKCDGDDLGIDPDWKAFLEEPGFPDWISGHSTIAYAAEVVSTEQFGDIDIFDVISHGTSSIEREYYGGDLGINPDRIAFLEEPGFPDWISGHSTMA